MYKYQKGEIGSILLLLFFIIFSFVLMFSIIDNKKFAIKEVEFKSAVTKDVAIQSEKFKVLGITESIVINYYKPCFEDNKDYVFLYLNNNYINADCAVKAITIAKVEGEQIAKDTRAAIEVWTKLPKTKMTYSDLYSK